MRSGERLLACRQALAPLEAVEAVAAGPDMARTRIGAAAALEVLPGWAAVEGRDAIRRAWRFRSFNAAFGFMTRVALTAERLDHHPEWFNVYDRVEAVLTTHDTDGVSELDVRMAQFMDQAAAAAGGEI